MNTLYIRTKSSYHQRVFVEYHVSCACYLARLCLQNKLVSWVVVGHTFKFSILEAEAGGYL